MRALLTKVFGDANQKTINQLDPTVDEISELETEMADLTDEELHDLGAEFRTRQQ